jgi:hypothetical protein
MRRGALLHTAFRSAFARSQGGPPIGAAVGGSSLRIRGAALVFVVGFPAAIGALALIAAVSRSGPSDGAFALGVGLLAAAGVLLALGLRSVLSVGEGALTVRFFGLRSTTVRFRDLRSATFGMAFPSISYAIALADRNGQKALVHSNWWRNESSVLVPVCRAIVDFDVPMDRSTARVVSQVLKVKRPKAQIIHRALLRKDRTW